MNRRILFERVCMKDWREKDGDQILLVSFRVQGLETRIRGRVLAMAIQLRSVKPLDTSCTEKIVQRSTDLKKSEIVLQRAERQSAK